MTPLWRIADVCAYLRVSRGTALKIAKEADARIQVAPGTVRYDPTRIRELMERRRGQ